jgi:hypothetical protein
MGRTPATYALALAPISHGILASLAVGLVFVGCFDLPVVLGWNANASNADAGNAIGLSCQVSGDGLTNCGTGRESCCTSLEVTGGTFYRVYDDAADGGAQPSLPMAVRRGRRILRS